MVLRGAGVKYPSGTAVEALMIGYNRAVDRFNEFCDTECKKHCGYCGNDSDGKDTHCWKCGIELTAKS